MVDSVGTVHYMDYRRVYGRVYIARSGSIGALCAVWVVTWRDEPARGDQINRVHTYLGNIGFYDKTWVVGDSF